MKSPELAISLAQLKANPDFVDIGDWPELRFDLRYASVRNFLARDLYQGLRFSFVHREAARKLQSAIANLKRARPDLRFLIYDVVRPQAIQRELWNAVVGTAQEKYIADPAVGSIHSYGFAVDLGLITADGEVLDMGTDFDDFTALAEPELEERHLRSGELTKAQHGHRLLLRNAMCEAGFTQFAAEWWHYDALARAQVVKSYQIVE